MNKKVKIIRFVFCFCLPLFFFSANTLNAQTSPTYYYVSPNGDDSNPGTELLPWKTLAKAASMATAGVTVFIRQGTYNEQLIPLNSGTAEKPIVFTSYPGDTATITGVGMEFPSGQYNDRWWNGLIHIQSLNHIKISGLRVINSEASGILVIGSSYITIEKNYTYYTYSPGISVNASDNITVEANEIVYGCIGNDQECISITGTNIFEIKNNCIHDGFTEGIDVKVGSSNGIVSNNEVYNQKGPNRVPPGIYIDAWDGHEYNIDVFDNISYNNGIGFDIGCESGGLLGLIKFHHNKAYSNDRGLWVGGWGVVTQKHFFNNIAIYGNEFYNNQFGMEIGGYTGTAMDSIEVFNNLIYHNKSAGVRITRYDGPSGEYVMRNVAIINNTIFGNGTVGNGWDAENGGINIFNIRPEYMLIKNNIISNNAVGTIHVSPEVPTDSIRIDYNFFDGFRNLVDEKTGTNAVYGYPSFVDTLINDYHLQDTSSAIDKGDPDQKYNDPLDPDKPGYALSPAQCTQRNDMGAYGGPFASSWDPTSYASIPPAPTLASPSNGATGIPTTILLNWNGPWGATSYGLQVSSSSDFSTLVVDSTNVTGQSYGIKDLARNTLYYWRVKATNAGGTSSNSNTWNFTTTGPTSLEQLSREVPIACALYQNYPNPFNQFTTIEFSLTKESPVKVTIFNSQGIEVKVLLDELLPPGHYRAQWIPLDNASGVYFCHLQTSEFIDTIKLLLQK